MHDRDEKRAELPTFLALTFALSAVLWGMIISAGSLRANGGLYVLALMWAPGVSAIVTRLIFQRSLRGLGWAPRGPRWLALAYVLPLLYGGVAYGLVWLTGLGGVDLSRFTNPVWMFVALGTLQSLMSATGEEIGWRGFLVPSFARRMSFGRTAVVSGAIWAGWHAPLIVLADYNAGTPAWYSLLWFVVLVIGISFPFAWLTLRSRSLWPAAVLHATHNLFIQGFFDRVTVDTGRTLWLTTEFGAVLALAGVVTGLVFWRARGAVAAGGAKGAVEHTWHAAPIGEAR